VVESKTKKAPATSPFIWVLIGLIVILCCCFVAGILCLFSLRINGSGNIATREQTLKNIQTINFNGIGQLNITQGKRESITIKADDNILPNVVVSESGSILDLSYQTHTWLGSINLGVYPTKLQYDVVVENLADLNIKGFGEVNVNNYNVDNLTIDLSGAGSLNINNLVAQNFNVDLSGFGSIWVKGNVNNQYVNLSGAGSYDAGAFDCKAATVITSGAGSAIVKVSDTLDATISGLGSINYWGNPTVNKNISGLGSIKRLGD
jgi:hypothetical protein